MRRTFQAGDEERSISPMKVVTAEQIRELDRRAMEECGIPGVVLMENAGRAVVEVMQHEYGDLRGKRVAVFCGTGNNGGDGFVIARYLRVAGALVMLYLAGSAEAIKGDAKVHFDILQHLGGFTTHDADSFPPNIGLDFCIDALLGTGLHDAPRGSFADFIRLMNACSVPIIAVDIPSGIDSDTGATPGEAVRATHTVTFAYPKVGLFLPPGSDNIGKLHVAAIGFDWFRLNAQTSLVWWSVEETQRLGLRLIAPFLLREREANKGDFGHVGVIAGSRGMAGAPCLVALGAQRAGAGLVTVLTAESAQPMVAAKLNEQMTIPLAELDGALSEAAFEEIAKFAAKASALCVGPGLTQKPQTVALVHRILTEIQCPLVLDADGLNALAQNPEIIKKRPEDPRIPLVLTPHPGEAARLLGTSVADVQSNRLASVRELAARYRAVVVLKGRYSLLSDPSGTVCINTSGNPGMATGGSGDTLTGILGGLLSQSVTPGRKATTTDDYLKLTASPLDVACLGVLLHGMAGDIAAEKIGETGLMAGDMIDALPQAIRRLEESQ